MRISVYIGESAEESKRRVFKREKKNISRTNPLSVFNLVSENRKSMGHMLHMYTVLLFKKRLDHVLHYSL